jgi:FkbM family methyltransferase
MANATALKGKFKYQLSKILPLNVNVKISLRNGLKFVVRARTMDRSVLKEVWIKEIYDKHGVKVEKGDTVVDIGGHIGIFSIYAAHLSETGKVYAFEPFIENFKRLEDHKKINHKENLIAYNKGVAETDGKQTLFLSPDKNTGGHSMHLKNQSERKVEIETINLIKFCDENKIDKIDFLKLDCEGAEFDILKGSEAILNRVKKVIMECHPYGENTCDKMVAMLEKNGFNVIRESNHIGGIEMLYCKR